jgi:hypothetical protein
MKRPKRLTSKERHRLADGVEAAVARIEERGWCQGAYTRGAAVCVSQAIREQLGVGSEDTYRVLQLFRSWLGIDVPSETADKPTEQVYEWNDSPDRRREEVIDSLKEFAEELRMGEVGLGASCAKKVRP